MKKYCWSVRDWERKEKIFEKWRRIAKHTQTPQEYDDTEGVGDTEDEQDSEGHTVRRTTTRDT